MRKEFVLVSEFAGLSVFLQYSQLPIVSNFYLLALILVWKYAGWKYAFLFVAVDQVMTFPLDVISYMNLGSIYASIPEYAKAGSDLMVKYLPKPSPDKSFSIIQQDLIQIGIIGLAIGVLYEMIRGIQRFFKTLSDIQKTVRWTHHD